MASIQGIYIALFRRPADPTGLAYFDAVTRSGADLAVIGDLSGQQEYRGRFVGMTNSQIVNSIYQSLFDRDGEPSGVAGYVAKLESGAFTINTIAINILDGARGDDLASANAKIAAADLFTARLDLAAEVAAYGPGNTISLAHATAVGRDYLDAVAKGHLASAAEADAAILKLFAASGQAPGGANPGGGTPVIHLPTAADGIGGTVLEAGLARAGGAVVDGTAPDATAMTTSGLLGYDFGPDGAAAASAFGWSNAVSAVASDGSTVLTAGGDPIVWSVAAGSDGRTLVGTATGTGAYAGQTVARLSLDDAATGAYSFTLLAPFDHGTANASGGLDTTALTFAYAIADASGDTATAQLTVSVADDGPRAQDVSVTPATGQARGNAIGPAAAGGIGMISADGTGHVTSVTLDGETHVYDRLGNLVLSGGGHAASFDAATHVLSVITGTKGKFSINLETGAYDYQGPIAANAYQRVGITAADSDGDAVSATIIIGTPKPWSTNATGGSVLEAGLARASGAAVDGTSPDAATMTTRGVLTYDFGPDGAAVASAFGWSTGVSVRASDGSTGLSAGGDPILWSLATGSDHRTLVGTATGTGAYAGQTVARLSLDDVATGAYSFTLLAPLDHKTANASGGLDKTMLTFAYAVRDASGDTATAQLTVSVADDAPGLSGATVTLAPLSSDINLMLTIDLSGSMNERETGGTRLTIAKIALDNLIDHYDGTNALSVMIVTFGDSAQAASPTWMTAAQAKAYIAGLVAVGATNYDAALSTTETAFMAGGKIAGGTNIMYFVSDGDPSFGTYSDPKNPGQTITLDHRIDAAEQGRWESFLAANDVKAHAVGIGRVITVASLNQVAFDGIKNVNIPSVLVYDPNDLGGVLTGTANGQTAGNAIGSAGVGGLGAMGADQSLHIRSLQLDGVTYTYNTSAHTISIGGSAAASSFDAATHVLTISTNASGIFAIDLDTGDYDYHVQNVTPATALDRIFVTVADADGDTATGVITIGMSPLATTLL